MGAGIWVIVSAMMMAELEPVRYRVSFPQPSAHLIEVEARIPTEGANAVELFLPVWTPGSYLVREYARHIEGMEAVCGERKTLPIERTRKNRWHVTTDGSAEIRLRYRVYAREMGVQTSWLDDSFALINGAGVFVTRVDGLRRPHEVHVERPTRWARVISGLTQTPAGGGDSFRANDYDELVDCPIYAGNPAVYEFQVDGKPQILVNEGENGIWDGPKSARDTESIVRAQRAFWGQLPYDRYVFFNILSEARGGLEHKNSTVLMASRYGTRTRNGYFNWLCLVSHEFFHVWNVKRLRPIELGPFDYENEVYTKSLWVAEGLTSYYDRLLVRRAGLCSVDEYLAGDPPGSGSSGEPAKSDIEKLHSTLGRLVQPLEAASYDSWIKFYRRDENTANTGISYYLKGAVVGWLLDANIRRATSGQRSLDDVMRLAYDRYSGERGFTPAEFRGIVREVAGSDLEEFFRKSLESTEELDYTDALDWFGLRFKPVEGPKADKPAKAWLGVETKSEGGRLLITHVRRDGPGFAAGLNVCDEILAFGDDRIRTETLAQRLEQYQAGEGVRVLVSRRDRLVRLDATLALEPKLAYAIEIDPKATDEQKSRRRAWLGE
jgi:predicted metalloprotease with PDZ domain